MKTSQVNTYHTISEAVKLQMPTVCNKARLGGLDLEGLEGWWLSDIPGACEIR